MSPQDTLEAKCRAIYSEAQAFFKNSRYGFKVLNSPPIYKPPYLFIGYQPGGGTKDFESETARGMHLHWPDESEYAVGCWPLSRITRSMFRLHMLKRSMSVFAIFLRYPSVLQYEGDICRTKRARVEDFCKEKVHQIIDVTEPEKIIAIGFATLRLFGPTQPDLRNAQGRVLTCTGMIGKRSAMGMLHLTGARMTRDDRCLIRDRVLAN